MRRIGLLALCGLLLSLPAAGCTQDGPRSPTGKLAIVASFYPLRFAAERVGGDRVVVRDLTKPGAEPHDLELGPGQVREIATADLVIYLKGFQPVVDETVAQGAADRALDAAAVMRVVAGPSASAGADVGPDTSPSAGLHAGSAPADNDPHLWLDPFRLAALGDRLAERLAELDSEHAGAYRDRASALRAELDALAAEYADGLRTCARREIFTSHAAFGYLAQRFGLTQIAISGLAPQTEPAPQRLAEVAEQARQHRATTIFHETLTSPDIAEVVARAAGARTAVLDPIEGLPAGSNADYFSVMRANLASLRSALGCA